MSFYFAPRPISKLDWHTFRQPSTAYSGTLSFSPYLEAISPTATWKNATPCRQGMWYQRRVRAMHLEFWWENQRQREELIDLLQVFHTVHPSSIILRITNRCHFFCNISLLYVSTLHVSGLYQPIIRGIHSCCYLLPLGSCGAWRMSACVWVFRWWWADRGPKHVG